MFLLLEQVGFSRTVSLFPGVTVATLCWGFGNQQSLTFSCLRRMYNCGGSPFHVLKLWKYSSHVRKNLVTWVFFLIFLPALLVRKCTKIIELIKFIFIFGTYQDFPKSCFSVLQKSFLINHDFLKIVKILYCKYLDSKICHIIF